MQPNQIIVRLPNWIGDACMATPILADLRTAFPSSEIVAMCQGFIGDLFKYDPNISEIFSFKKMNGWIHKSNPEQIISQIKKGHFDLGLLLTNSFSSAYWFFRGHVKERIGFSTHLRGLFLTKRVQLPKNIEQQHHVITYKMLLKPLGIPISHTRPQLYLTADEKAQAKRTLSGFDGKIIGINPGAAFGSSKCWPKEHFRRLIKKILTETKHTVVLFGDSFLKNLTSDIASGLGDQVINLAGKTTIRELMALIEACDVFLSNDSGPMHIAAALNVPLIALFGSTNPTKTGPYGHGKVIYKKVFCSPCYRKTCPIDFQCMLTIEENEVFSNLMETLDGNRLKLI